MGSKSTSYIEKARNRSSERIENQAKAEARVPITVDTPVIKAMLFVLTSVLFFLAVCLGTEETIKWTSLIGGIVTTAVIVWRYKRIAENNTLIFLSVTGMVTLAGISTLYAVSQKFALYEFLKVYIAFFVFVIVFAFAKNKGESTGRFFASAMEIVCAVISFASIDMIATRRFYKIFANFLGIFGADYDGYAGVLDNRLASVFGNENVYSACAAIAIFLSLGLIVTSNKRSSRICHEVCLIINSITFILGISRGAMGIIALAFVVYAFAEHKDRRAYAITLMIITLAVALLASYPIFANSFGDWDGVDYIPLYACLAGAVAVPLIYELLGRRIAFFVNKLKFRNFVHLGFLAAGMAFVLLALTLTTGTVITENSSLMRTVSLEPGEYTVTAESDKDFTIGIYSENEQQVLMGGSTQLYYGSASEAKFTVPDDSEITYLYFYAGGTELALNSVTVSGSDGDEYGVNLKYKILPEFIAMRLQDVTANSSTAQRLVYYKDGIKLFLTRPLFGRGLGSFENGSDSVKNFYYETKYAHNHYVQSLHDNGIVGFVLFVGTLVFCAWAALKARIKGNFNPLVPCLGAALVFTALHGGFELDFSAFYFTPFAYGLFALISICCGNELPKLNYKETYKKATSFVVATLVLVYAGLLTCNIVANKICEEKTYESFAEAAALDPFEWLDHEISYVYSAYLNNSGNKNVMTKANEFISDLENVDSNVVHLYLAECYFAVDNNEKAFSELKRHVNYCAAKIDAWEESFDLIEKYYEENSDVFKKGIIEIYDMLKTWDENHIGSLNLSSEAVTFITNATATENSDSQ